MPRESCAMGDSSVSSTCSGRLTISVWCQGLSALAGPFTGSSRAFSPEIVPTSLICLNGPKSTSTIAHLKESQDLCVSSTSSVRSSFTDKRQISSNNGRVQARMFPRAPRDLQESLPERCLAAAPGSEFERTAQSQRIRQAVSAPVPKRGEGAASR